MKNKKNTPDAFSDAALLAMIKAAKTPKEQFALLKVLKDNNAPEHLIRALLNKF